MSHLDIFVGHHHRFSISFILAVGSNSIVSFSSNDLFFLLVFLDTKMHKINHLRYFIFNSLRTLVLVGDSGEIDPEIYGFIARQYPKRVHRIFIRAVKGEKKDDERFTKAFEGISKEKWSIFTDPLQELPEDLKLN